MRLSDIPLRPPERLLRQFAGLWIVVFGGLSVDQGSVRGRTTLALALGVLSVAVGLLGLVAPRLIRPIYVGWMVAAFPIGWVVSHVMLALLYYGLFTPVSLVFRLAGRDALHRRRRPDLASYFIPKPMPTDPASYLRQY